MKVLASRVCFKQRFSRVPHQTCGRALASDALQAEERIKLRNLTFTELEAFCARLREKPTRAVQIWSWLYKRFLDKWDEALDQQNGFSRGFITRVEQFASLDADLELVSTTTAADHTRKLLFQLPGFKAQVETVLIPVDREGRRSRVTICVSSQVGCAMNCQFCYTGKMGLLASLSTAQIAGQLVAARRLLAADPQSPPATNIVFMGMGEPLDNLDAVLAAIEIATHPLGLNFSSNKITVSTVGLVPEIRRFCASSSAQLAVSLHAPTDEVRDLICPVNRRYPLEQLMACLREQFPAQEPQSQGRRSRHVLFEYVMLKGVNDSEEQARQVVALIRGVECKFNLILFNSFRGTMFEASNMDVVVRFRSILVEAGLVCTVRDSRGQDEMAACGQLGNPQMARKIAALPI